MDQSVVTAVDAAVERICDKGCRGVWADIDALARQDPVPEVGDLSAAERASVLRELRAIMAVYGTRQCSLG